MAPGDDGGMDENENKLPCDLHGFPTLGRSLLGCTIVMLVCATIVGLVGGFLIAWLTTD
jgi:hypothetical protein